MVRTILYNGIKWILVKDDGVNQLYRHPTDRNRRLSVLDPNYTFQPSDIDTFLTEGVPDNNWGNQTLIRVGGGFTGNAYRSLLKFDMSSQVPVGAIINSASLSLYYYTHSTYDPVGRTIWAYRLTRTGWTELGATWNKYDGTNAWTTAGGDYATTDGASAAVPAGYDWMSWTVTAQVQTAVDSVSRVAHFLMRDGTETGSTLYILSYYSREYTTDTTKRPKLYVDWQTGVTYISASDSGAGAESVSVGLSVADSGAGVEANPVIGPLATDAAVGAEAVAMSAETAVLTDTGVGVDSPLIIGGISASDSGLGSETSLAVENHLPETDAGIGSESLGVSASLTATETGAGVETPSVDASIPISDSAVGSELVTPTSQFTVTDSGILSNENVTTPGTLIVTDEGKGAEFAWRIKPSTPMIDALALPHVLSIRISDPATMSDKKVQGGSLPRRTMVGKPGRTVDVQGWSDSQTEIDAVEALRDGLHHTFYHPSGDSFGVLVTGFEPSRSVDEYNRRAYRLSLAEAN